MIPSLEWRWRLLSNHSAISLALLERLLMIAVLVVFDSVSTDLGQARPAGEPLLVPPGPPSDADVEGQVDQCVWT